MKSVCEIKQKLVSFAERVRMEVLFDMKVDVSTSEFLKTKFHNDELEKKKITNSIYKYYF